MYRLITALFLGLASMSSWGQATVGFDLSGGSTFSTGGDTDLVTARLNYRFGGPGLMKY